MLDLSTSLEEILCALIAIPSVTGNELAIAKAIQQSLAQYGLTPSSTHNNNLIYTITTNNKTHLACVAHLDTVPPDAPEQLTPSITDNRIYGRGAVDMKASIAVMLKILWEIATEKTQLQYTTSFIFYTAEEGPLPNGLTELIAENILPKIDLAYVLEPTQQTFQVGCLGMLTVSLNIKGKSAHSAQPWLGENAITKAQPIISAVASFDPAEVSRDGISFRESMTVVGIRTSNAHNVVPDNCELTISYRFGPQYSVEQAITRLKEVVQTENITIHDASPSCMLEADSKANELLDPTIPRGFFKGWTDIAQLQQAGIPAVNFGPGDISVAHTAYEYVGIEKITKFLSQLKTVLL